ncbi:MAG: exodeoxyribonuclease VII small subunit [Pseudomonadota bacterium]
MADEPKDIASLSFEEALSALDHVVTKLEGGDVPLDQSIALYERGEALRQHCERQLKEAELKVEKIVAARDGTADVAPFDAG